MSSLWAKVLYLQASLKRFPWTGLLPFLLFSCVVQDNLLNFSDSHFLVYVSKDHIAEAKDGQEWVYLPENKDEKAIVWMMHYMWLNDKIRGIGRVILKPSVKECH